MMRIKSFNFILLFLTILLLLGVGQTSWAASLRLGVTPAPVDGTSVAAIVIDDAIDVESFSLTLNFSSGTTLALTSAGWFNRYEYYPASPFGPAPQVDKNHIQASELQTKVFLNGFAPVGGSGSVGVVTFDVTNNGSQILSLSGQYLSRSTGQVENFVDVTATFNIGSYPDPVAGDVNNDGDVNLEDIILALQIMTGIPPSQFIYTEADAGSDSRIGIEEVIHALKRTSE